MDTPAQTQKKFRRLCKRLGVPARRTTQALQVNWMNAVRDALVLARVKGEVQTRFRYLQEVQKEMPRKKATPPAAAPAAPAATVAGLPPLPSLPGAPAAPAGLPALPSLPAAPAAAPAALPSLPAAPANTTPVQGLDALAQGVTPEAIQQSIAQVTGGAASSAGDAVMAKALIDVKAQLDSIAGAITALDSRVQSLLAEMQKGMVALAQRIDSEAAENKRGFLAVQANIRELLEDDGSHATPPATASGPAAYCPPTEPAVQATTAPAGGRPAAIVGACGPALAEKGNPAYPDSQAVWEILAAIAGTQVQPPPDWNETRVAFHTMGRLNGGVITY